MKQRRVPRSPLAVWLDANGITMREFGRRIGIPHSKLSGVVDGRALPGVIVAYEIERLTLAEVPMESWLGCDIAKGVMAGLRSAQPREYQPESFRKEETDGAEGEKEEFRDDD